MTARQRLLPLLVALGVLAVVAGAFWALAAGTSARPAAGPGEVALPGGLARVDQVVSAARPMMAMPGMGMDQDPVPEGQRRVSVEVTLFATQDRTLQYKVDEFALDVPGAGARAPHRAILPGTEIPAGTQRSGTLIFEIPVDATTGSLSYDGDGATQIALPPETAFDHPSGGDGQHQDHGTTPGGGPTAGPTTG